MKINLKNVLYIDEVVTTVDSFKEWYADKKKKLISRYNSLEIDINQYDIEDKKLLEEYLIKKEVWKKVIKFINWERLLVLEYFIIEYF